MDSVDSLVILTHFPPPTLPPPQRQAEDPGAREECEAPAEAEKAGREEGWRRSSSKERADVQGA